MDNNIYQACHKENLEKIKNLNLISTLLVNKSYFINRFNFKQPLKYFIMFIKLNELNIFVEIKFYKNINMI